MTFTQIATAFLKAVSGQLDPYTERNGVVQVGDDGQSVVLFTPSHIQFAKYGRGPGKQPPLDPILAWVKSKGVITDSKKQKGTAFAIAKSISKKGTKNWVKGAPNALNEAINDNLQNYYKNLSKIIMIEQTKQLDAIYQKEFPETIKFEL